MTEKQMNLVNKLIDTKDLEQLSKQDRLSIPVLRDQQLRMTIECASTLIGKLLELPNKEKSTKAQEIKEILNGRISNKTKQQLECLLNKISVSEFKSSDLNLEEIKTFLSATDRKKVIAKFL